MRNPDDLEMNWISWFSFIFLNKLMHQQVDHLRTTRIFGFQLRRLVMIILIWHLSKEKFMTGFCKFRDEKKWILKIIKPIKWIFGKNFHLTLVPYILTKKGNWRTSGWIPRCICQTSFWCRFQHRTQNRFNARTHSFSVCSRPASSNPPTWWKCDWTCIVTLF